jgi:hypothetical protein
MNQQHFLYDACYFWKLLKGKDFLFMLQNIENENFISERIADKFCMSFVVSDKKIYCKSPVANTLTYLGTLQDLGACLVRQLVKSFCYFRISSFFNHLFH